jgi:hypothetical protein
MNFWQWLCGRITDFSTDKNLDVSGSGRVRIKNLEALLREPKVQEQIELIENFRKEHDARS